MAFPENCKRLRRFRCKLKRDEGRFGPFRFSEPFKEGLSFHATGQSLYLGGPFERPTESGQARNDHELATQRSATDGEPMSDIATATRCSCFCEFGYLNFYVLPALRVYFETTRERLALVTYPDYFRLLQLLFGDRVEAAELLEQDPLRGGFASPKYDRLYADLPKVNDLLEDHLTSLPRKPNLHRVREQSLIAAPRDLTETMDRRFGDAFDDIVVFYLRNRSNSDRRNYLGNLDWSTLEADRRLLVFVGDAGESLVPLPEGPTVYRTRDLFENIYFFAHCSCFVANDSGIIDFAKNCGCRMVRIVPSRSEVNPKNYRPFNSCVTKPLEAEYLLPEWQRRPAVVEVKLERLVSRSKRASVERELSGLQRAMAELGLGVDSEIFRQLLALHRRNWDLIERWNELDREGRYDDEYIAVTRASNQCNRERFLLKRKLNERSVIVEEKSAIYDQPPSDPGCK